MINISVYINHIEIKKWFYAEEDIIRDSMIFSRKPNSIKVIDILVILSIKRLSILNEYLCNQINNT